MAESKGATVTARFSPDGITMLVACKKFALRRACWWPSVSIELAIQERGMAWQTGRD